MVQSRIQQCRLHINYMVIRSREPVSTQRAEQREEVGNEGDRPHTTAPSLPFQTFRRLFLYFVKPAFLKSFKWQASFPQISPFRNILKMEYIFIWSSQRKQSSLFSLTATLLQSVLD